MCLSQQKLKKIKECENKQQGDKILLYPYSKFPSQIIGEKLYLGNVYSSNSELQLNDLKITTLIDFIDYNQGEKVADFKVEQNNHKYQYIHLPFNNNVNVAIDFDLINMEIDKKISSDAKVLLYCRDGQVIAPAFAISYLMYKTKIDINMATLKVCQAISRVQISKWIYTQLLTYKPKK